MHMSRLIASFSLLALLACGQACAKDSIDANAAPPAGSLKARGEWEASQAIVQIALRVDVEATGDTKANSFWMFMERTPNGRMRAVIKDDPEAKPRLTFLVQENTNLAMAGEDVSQPPAAWALGHYLFGQALEPAMLLQWALGLPGKDFRLGEPVADVVIDGSQTTHISQAGWQVEYGQWTAAGDGRPSLPKQMRLLGDESRVVVSMVEMDARAVAPAGYQEFEIR